MTATHPTTDRSLSVTTRNLRRRAPTHSAEANQQVGTFLSSRHATPAPTPACVPQTPSKPPASPPRHRHPPPPPPPPKPPPSPPPPPPPPAGSPPRLSFPSLALFSLLLLRLFTHSVSVISPPLHSPPRLFTNTSPVPAANPVSEQGLVWTPG